MTIREIIDNKLVGGKFILNQNFKLEESFDPGTIFFIDYCIEDSYQNLHPNLSQICYKIGIRIVKEDFKHNFSIAQTNWYDQDKNPVLNIYQSIYPGYYVLDASKIKAGQLIRPIEATIFVMDSDDCFDLELSYYRNKKLSELGI